MAATSGGRVPAAPCGRRPADVLALPRRASGPSALSRAQDVGVADVGAVGPRLRRHAGLALGLHLEHSIGPSPPARRRPRPSASTRCATPSTVCPGTSSTCRRCAPAGAPRQPARTSRSTTPTERSCPRRRAPPTATVSPAPTATPPGASAPRRPRSGPAARRRSRPARSPARPRYTAPVSRPSSTSMRHTPVSESPARMARSTGAAPRHRGSNEKWMFTIGTAASTGGLMSPPNVTTTPSDGSGSSAVTASDSSPPVGPMTPPPPSPGSARASNPAPAACRPGSPRARSRGRRPPAPAAGARPPPACRGRPGATSEQAVGLDVATRPAAVHQDLASVFFACLRWSSARCSISSTPSRWSKSRWNKRASSSSASIEISLPSRS